MKVQSKAELTERVRYCEEKIKFLEEINRLYKAQL